MLLDFRLGRRNFRTYYLRKDRPMENQLEHAICLLRLHNFVFFVRGVWLQLLVRRLFKFPANDEATW